MNQEQFPAQLWKSVTSANFYQAVAQRRLEIQCVLKGNVLEEAVLGGRRREKGESSEQAEVGTADRIDSAPAGGRAENRLKDESSGKTRLRKSFGLGRPSRRGEVRSASL